MQNRLTNSALHQEFVSFLLSSPIDWGNSEANTMLPYLPIPKNLFITISILAAAYYDYKKTHYLEKAISVTTQGFTLWSSARYKDTIGSIIENEIVDEEKKPFLFSY